MFKFFTRVKKPTFRKVEWIIMSNATGRVVGTFKNLFKAEAKLATLVRDNYTLVEVTR